MLPLYMTFFIKARDLSSSGMSANREMHCSLNASQNSYPSIFTWSNSAVMLFRLVNVNTDTSSPSIHASA